MTNKSTIWRSLSRNRVLPETLKTELGLTEEEIDEWFDVEDNTPFVYFRWSKKLEDFGSVMFEKENKTNEPS